MATGACSSPGQMHLPLAMPRKHLHQALPVQGFQHLHMPMHVLLQQTPPRKHLHQALPVQMPVQGFQHLHQPVAVVQWQMPVQGFQHLHQALPVQMPVQMAMQGFQHLRHPLAAHRPAPLQGFQNPRNPLALPMPDSCMHYIQLNRGRRIGTAVSESIAHE